VSSKHHRCKQYGLGLNELLKNFDKHAPLVFQQTEIDTHLNVLYIHLNGNYESAPNTEVALDTMVSIFGRSSSWHFTSPTGIQPDLHHALLGKSLNGGIAYVGAICNSDVGFGLSASLSGSYQSMSQAVVWDMIVVSNS
jgi:hypothetical protein